MRDAREACGGAFVLDDTSGSDYLETTYTGYAQHTLGGESTTYGGTSRHALTGESRTTGRSVTRKRRAVTLRVTCKKGK